LRQIDRPKIDRPKIDRPKIDRNDMCDAPPDETLKPRPPVSFGGAWRSVAALGRLVISRPATA